MRRVHGATLLALAAGCAGLAGGATPATAPRGDSFLTAYVEPQNADYAVYYEQLRATRFLESVAEQLNRVLRLPVAVTLRIAECGHSTTRWDADSRTVTVCYEFLDALVVIAAERANSQGRAEQLFSGAVTFALFAEIGRALVDLYRLPAPHGAFAAGDEFAAITLAGSEHSGDSSAAAAIEFFDAALKSRDAGLEYLDTHAFDRARLETVACILYGNAPGNHARARELKIVPPARAPRCAEEVLAVAHAWDKNLHEHTRGAAVARP